MNPAKILVVDDEAYVRDSVVALLEAEGHTVLAAPDGKSAQAVAGEHALDLVITDLQMPGIDGLALMAELHTSDPDLPVVVLTGVGTIEGAVAAMQAGALDFIQKPVETDRLLLVVARAIERRSLLAEVHHLRHTVGDLRGDTTIVGDSPEIVAVREGIGRAAPSDATVLVTGESGTGKELVARAIHRHSERADGPLVLVNCAAIPETLFESELFGHRRGSFTGATDDRIGRFAEASGGTLVLDEIGTIHPGLQAKLLRVLESGEYQVIGDPRVRVADVRVVAVTNEDLPARVADGAFRSDLYYRLAVYPIAIPPLRARLDDIAPLADHFLPSTVAPLDDDARAVLRDYDWPGNVRELKNILERAVLIAGGARAGATVTLDAALLERVLGAPGGVSRSEEGGDPDAALGLDLKTRTEALEGRLIRAALSRARGKKKVAAELLGIDPRNLAYHLRKHGIEEA